MSEFCNKCRPSIIGTKEDMMKFEEFNNMTDEEWNRIDESWSCEPDGLCEECGYEYLNGDDK